MKHIEFTGPAGSGKSLLVEILTGENEYLFSKNKLIYNHFSSNPGTQTIMSLGGLGNIAKLGWSRYTKYKFFFEFAKYNPNFLSNSVLFIQRQRGRHSNKEVSMMNVMSVYQLARETLTDNEILVLDEGFYHKTAVHAKHGELPSDQYLSSMPTPDILIHVDPPIALARQRCKNRDGEVATRELYEKSKQIKKDLISMARQVGVHVIEVQNEGDVESTVDQIRPDILELMNSGSE